MKLILMLFLGVLGASIGSFLNVVFMRGDMSWAKGRSRCDSCGYQLSWHDNVPILSFLFLRGKCRKCKSPIPPQHFYAEILGFIVFASLGINDYIVYDVNLLVPLLLVMALLCYSAISDLHTMTIPMIPTMATALIMLIYMIGNNVMYGTYCYWWIVALYIVGWLNFDVICEKYELDNIPFLGLGDIDMFLLFGIMIPVINKWEAAIPNIDMIINLAIELNYYILCSCMPALVVIVPQIASEKRGRRQPFAYVPFMYLGIALYLLNVYLRQKGLVPWI